MQANSSTTTVQVQIELADRSYAISIGSQLLGNSLTYRDLPRAATALVVSNTTVAPLYAAQLVSALQPHYGRVL